MCYIHFIHHLSVLYALALLPHQGFSGTVEMEDSDYPVGATMDDCKPDGSKPCIMG